MIICELAAPPGPVTNLEVLTVTSKSVTLQWSPPKSTGGTELTSYIIERRTESSNTWEKIATLETSVTQHSILNLKERETFIFRVTPENSIGMGPGTCTESIKLKTHASKEFLRVSVYCLIFNV